MKKLIVLSLCLMIALIGCGKKTPEVVEEVIPTEAPLEVAEPTVAPTEAPLEGAVITKAAIKGVAVTDEPDPTSTPTPVPTNSPTPTVVATSTPEPEPTKAPQTSATSEHVPPSGYYANGSSENFCYMNIYEIDASSFSFSIHRGETGETIFNSNTASFESQDSTTAYYRGQSYTLTFDCSSYGTITVSGFGGIEGGNTFWNTDIHQAG